MEIDTYFLHAITTDSGMDLEYKTVFHVRVALEKKNLPSPNLQQHGSRRSTDPQRNMGAALDTLRQGEAEWAAGAVSRKGAGRPRTSQTRLDDVTAIPAS